MGVKGNRVETFGFPMPNTPFLDALLTGTFSFYGTDVLSPCERPPACRALPLLSRAFGLRVGRVGDEFQ